MSKSSVSQLQGILALVDVVNFTSQANKMGDTYTAQYLEYFQEKIKVIVEKYDFRVVKTMGDSVLVFGSKPDGLLDIMLDLYERNKPENTAGFISRFRLVAHSSYFQFKIENDNPVDLVSPEGIKVFRMEKLADTWEMVVTHTLYQGLKPLLNQYRIEAERMVLNEPLKGFGNQELFPPFYRLRIAPESADFSNLLERRLEELEKEVQTILVFGNIYDPVPMEKNFINLSMKWTPGHERDSVIGISRTVEPEDKNKKRRHKGIQEEKDEWLDYGLSRKPSDGVMELNVPALYKNHYRGIIVGLPGAGKTTILKNLAYQEFKSSEPDKEKLKRVVLFVPCRDLPSFHEWHILHYGQGALELNRESALEYLTWFFLFGAKKQDDVTLPEERVEFLNVVKIVTQAFRENRLTLLIDALDEAPNSDAKEWIVQLFLLLVTESPGKNGNRFFLTSRPSKHFLPEQKEIPLFYVLSLTKEQVRTVAKQLMSEDSKIYQKFDQAIWQEEMVMKMASTPLTALLVTAYFNAYEKFHHRFSMYDLLVTFILFRVWESIKAGTFSSKNLDSFFDEVKKKEFLEKKREIRILYNALASLCFQLFYDTHDGKIQRDMDEELLLSYFKEFIDRHMLSDNKVNLDVQAEQWLEQFKDDHLLLHSGKTRYVFVHSTVMEFLGAYYIVKQVINNKQELDKMVDQCLRNVDQLDLETLPIAISGDELPWGFGILSILRELKVTYDRELLYEMAGRCLVELEWYITKIFQVHTLKNRRQYILDTIEKNHSAIEWIYLYLKKTVLTSDKRRLREKIDRFAALLKLSRDTLFKEYLEFKDFDRGDSELVGLRRELLLNLVKKDLVEQWFREHYDLASAGNGWQWDTWLFHPENKNFRYFKDIIGNELQGFLGSPNMRHLGAVRACSFSPDGKTFVSASADGTLKLWDAANGKEIRAFEGHKYAAYNCAFAPDGKSLVSTSRDSSLKLWDVAGGKEIRTFSGHKNAVTGCAFSPDGGTLLSASEDRTLKLWEVASGKEIRTFSGHTAAVLNCAFSRDGRTVLSASEDGTLKLWEVDTGKEIRTFPGHNYAVLGCAFSPDGVFVVSASRDNTMKLWDVESGREVRVFTGHTGDVLSCAFSPSGTYLISTSFDKSLKLWDVNSGREIRTFVGHKAVVWGCAFSPDGAWLVSASGDYTLKLWEVEEGKEVYAFKGHKRAVLGCAFSPNNAQLVSTSGDHTLKLWDMADGKEIHTLTGHTAEVWGCAFSPDGETFVSASADGTLKLWDAKSGNEIRTLTGHQGAVLRCAFSPDSKHIVSASRDKTLKLWQVADGKEIRTFDGHTEDVSSCSFSPSGSLLVSTSDDKTLKLWEMEKSREIRTFTGHTDAVLNCAFSPDGSYLASASKDHTIKLLKVKNNKTVHTFNGHKDWVLSCIFSPSGNHLISISKDQTIKLWDVESRKLLKSLPLPWIPYFVAISKDNRVITGNQNGTLTLFKFAELE